MLVLGAGVTTVPLAGLLDAFLDPAREPVLPVFSSAAVLDFRDAARPGLAGELFADETPAVALAAADPGPVVGADPIEAERFLSAAASFLAFIAAARAVARAAIAAMEFGSRSTGGGGGCGSEAFSFSDDLAPADPPMAEAERIVGCG